MERLILIVFAAICILHSGVYGIGVNYGFLGDNLPPPEEVISLLKSRNITKIRIFEPNVDVLKALEGSSIEVIIGVRNEDLKQLARNKDYAISWVNTNIVPHASLVKFTYISAGNEVIPGDLAVYVLRAMQHLHDAINKAGYNIPITTSVATSVLGSSYPPSSGIFADINIMKPIAQFLEATQSPLLINVYPYFAYVGDPFNIQLEYALFKKTANGVVDNNIRYNNIFDAMVDATYAALEKVGCPDVKLVVSETGWPSDGSDSATIENAETYVNNVVAHVSSGQGTPKRSDKILEAYIFALFNENQKPEGVEQNWGLFYPNKTEVYNVPRFVSRNKINKTSSGSPNTSSGPSVSPSTSSGPSGSPNTCSGPSGSPITCSGPYGSPNTSSGSQQRYLDLFPWYLFGLILAFQI